MYACAVRPRYRAGSMIPLGTYELAAFPWFKMIALAAIILNAVCFALMFVHARDRLR